MVHQLASYTWINPPEAVEITETDLQFKTQPGTDFWQRTHYGFQNDNGHAFVFQTELQNFTYEVRTIYKPQTLYDQSGVIVYLDSENWIKASIEYHNPQISRLGSVVTNHGYSDWATTDIKTQDKFNILYRLSRRKNDYLIECSFDGKHYGQMRICHLHDPSKEIGLGVYACSPQDSSFLATFTDFSFGDCLWESE